MEENNVKEENNVLEGEVQETALTNVEPRSSITSFQGRQRRSNTTCETITNIKDEKVLYNLSTNADFKLNDCTGEKIRVKGIVINFYNKELKEPIVDEETGEIQEFERKVSCVLLDDNGKSYATGSKTFAWQLINFIDKGYTTEEKIAEKGLEIEIIKKAISGSSNKVLGFKLV